MTRKSVWNWEQEISEREILNIYRLITQEWVISSLCLIQGNNPNFKLPQLLVVTHPYSSTVIKSLTKNCQLLQSELSCWSVNYSAVGFSLHVCSPMEGSNGSTVSGDFTGGTEGDLAALVPGPEGGGSVSQTGFWDLAKTNTVFDFVLHFGWDAGDLGSLLQISLNILKTDGDNQWFLASISSITLHDCNIPSVNRNGCHADIYFTSHCWSYQNCHSRQPPITAAPPLPTDSLKRYCMISGKFHYRLWSESLFSFLNYLPSHFQLRQGLSTLVA